MLLSEKNLFSLHANHFNHFSTISSLITELCLINVLPPGAGFPLEYTEVNFYFTFLLPWVNFTQIEQQIENGYQEKHRVQPVNLSVHLKSPSTTQSQKGDLSPNMIYISCIFHTMCRILGIHLREPIICTSGCS